MRIDSVITRGPRAIADPQQSIAARVRQPAASRGSARPGRHMTGEKFLHAVCRRDMRRRQRLELHRELDVVARIANVCGTRRASRSGFVASSGGASALRSEPAADRKIYIVINAGMSHGSCARRSRRSILLRRCRSPGGTSDTRTRKSPPRGSGPRTGRLGPVRVAVIPAVERIDGVPCNQHVRLLSRC